MDIMQLSEDIFKLKSLIPVNGGHINDTFLLDSPDGKYILQKVGENTDIRKLMYNYSLYSEAFKGSGLLCPEWLLDKEGNCFYTDNEGNRWRMYPFIEGEILSPPVTDSCFFALGQGLAKMHMALSKVKDNPHPVYPHLHDPRFYYEEYRRCIGEKPVYDVLRDPDVEKEIESRISVFGFEEKTDISVIHGDTKLSNILFKEGKVIAFIDFDTLMSGSLLEDIADCIRSCCIRDDKLDEALAGIIIDGYADIYRGSGIIDIKKKLPAVFNRLCFTLALRYYVDSFCTRPVFKEKYPGYRLQRTRELLKLTWQ